MPRSGRCARPSTSCSAAGGSSAATASGPLSPRRAAAPFRPWPFTAGDTLALTGRGSEHHGEGGAARFTALVRALAENGTVATFGDQLSVTGANAVTLLVSIGSSYRSYKDAGGDFDAVARQHLAAASSKTYADLRSAHVADHRALFGRVLLTLGEPAAAASATIVPDRARTPLTITAADFAPGNAAKPSP